MSWRNLSRIRIEKYPRETAAFTPNSIPYPEKQLDYRANVLNEHARQFYHRHGAEVLEPAFEILSEMSRERGHENQVLSPP